ncbi:hypothetical protein [Micromonospora sp. NPDC005324]|uniref:hypothetical protein n=1 Tax=Micromonospora sp. NPDC005324 TaxID=3157033 RepID=UPI0033BB5C68
MLLVAAITDSFNDQDIAFTRMPDPPGGPLLVVDDRRLRQQVWRRLDDGQELPPDASALRVPLWACHIDAATAQATFYATTQRRPAAAVLVAFHHTRMPTRVTTDVTGWAHALVGERAEVNFPVPRPGRRPSQGPEVETKITLSAKINPLAVARILLDHLSTIGTPVSDSIIYRRILRSEIYRPAGSCLREYAALTPRPDGSWWAKAKFLLDGQLHKSIRPATDQEHALALVSEALGRRPLDKVGQLLRSTWDVPSPTDQDGHWSTITVDTSTLAPYLGTLQQVEIEYGACLTAAPATTGSPPVRRAVESTADAVADALSAHGIPHVRFGQSKIEHFLNNGRNDDCD